MGERIASATTSSRVRPRLMQRGDCRVLVAPMALGAARRERVAGHDVAILQRAFRLIVQRGANVLDRVDEVQPVSERLQVGVLRAGIRRRHHELGEIEQRTGMRRANRSRRAEPAPVAPLQARRCRERFFAGVAIDRDKGIELGVRDRDRRHHLGVRFDRHRLQDRQHDLVDAGKKFRKRVARAGGVEQQLRVDDVLVAVGIEREDAHAGCRT